MRIGIDARFYGLPAGIGRYTEKLISYLEKIDQVNEYFIFLTKKGFNYYQPQNPNFHKVLADYRWSTLREQIFFPFKLYKFRLDFVHFLQFNAFLLYFGKFIITIHDLTQRQLSRKASTRSFLVFYFKKLAYFLVIRSAIKRSKRIIAVSQFVKQEIIKYYKIDSKKITVIYESAE